MVFADQLRAEIGWNQTPRDWAWMRETHPNGCFIGLIGNTPVATASTLVYSDELAWIGMVMVQPRFQRQGIGTAMLHHCLTVLKRLNVGTIKLDATPQGHDVYKGMGFETEWTLNRWERRGEKPRSNFEGKVIHRRLPDSCLALDHHAFGSDRSNVLDFSLKTASCFTTLSGGQAEPHTGFGFLRAGSHAAYLGPIVASGCEQGHSITRHLLQYAEETRVFWDIPDENLDAVEWAKEMGFTIQRSFIRMFLGPNPSPGYPKWIWGIADPAWG